MNRKRTNAFSSITFMIYPCIDLVEDQKRIWGWFFLLHITLWG